jgi:hypothetical protein
MSSQSKAAKKPTTKNQVIAGIEECARKLGRVPNVAELESNNGISRKVLRRHFPSLRQAIRAAGLEPTLERTRNRSGVMLEDWGEVARKMGRLPSTKHYDAAGRFSKGTFWLRFGPWNTIPDHFRDYVQANGAEEKWQDVLAMVEQRELGAAAVRGGAIEKAIKMSGKVSNGHHGAAMALARAIPNFRRRSPIFADRPVYGAPIPTRGLAYEPVNETGVVLLFGILAWDLGFHVERVQTEFPDCEAMFEVQPGKWQRVRIEFEYESRNFKIHRHPVDKCDIIVCWRHNWAECPRRIKVVELSEVIAGTVR